MCAHLIGKFPARSEQPLPAVHSHHNHLLLKASHRTYTHVIEQLSVQLWRGGAVGGGDSTRLGEDEERMRRG